MTAGYKVVNATWHRINECPIGCGCPEGFNDSVNRVNKCPNGASYRVSGMEHLMERPGRVQGLCRSMNARLDVGVQRGLLIQ